MAVKIITERARRSYDAAVRTWAEGGTAHSLEDILEASHHTLNDFSRDVKAVQRKIDAGELQPRKIQGVPLQ